MSERPKPCHYDRGEGERVVTNDHHDQCPDKLTCDGCLPCPHDHCRTCRRAHLDDAHPRTCDRCVAGVRADLAAIGELGQALLPQALHAGNDGRLAAAAPIPGGTAMVLLAPSTAVDDVLTSRTYGDDHSAGDPIPPLAVLRTLEVGWRTWHEHEIRHRTGSVAGALDYLGDHLTGIAQATMRLDSTNRIRPAPDFAATARAIGGVRTQLEYALHDEREPEYGVECFECGSILQRRFRRASPCRHYEQARANGMRPDQWLHLLATYPELAEEHARCDQGGLKDPSAGVSWDCPACRMTYTPGEYATAVRRALLDDTDATGYGWTDIKLAADAATTLTGRAVLPATVWKWVQRDKVPVVCSWQAGRRSGRRLVFWPDVADQATGTSSTRKSA